METKEVCNGGVAAADKPCPLPITKFLSGNGFNPKFVISFKLGINISF